KLQASDIYGRLLHAVIQHDAHQLGESLGPIAGTADGRRQRRHQMIEGITLLAPILQNVGESVFFGDDPYADILLVLAFAFEQPAIDLLTLLGARLDNLRARRAGVSLKIPRQPKLERMHFGDVAAIR